MTEQAVLEYSLCRAALEHPDIALNLVEQIKDFRLFQRRDTMAFWLCATEILREGQRITQLTLAKAVEDVDPTLFKTHSDYVVWFQHIQYYDPQLGEDEIEGALAELLDRWL